MFFKAYFYNQSNGKKKEERNNKMNQCLHFITSRLISGMAK